MSDYRKNATDIIELVGGLDNIESVQHCMTRLRFILKDESKAKQSELEELDAVKGIVKAAGQFQIVLGTGVVNKVYKEVEKIFGENGKESKQLEGGTFLQRISRLFGDIFIPIIPIIVASGVLMGVRTYLTSSGMLATDSEWYTIAAVLIDTGFAFLPALVCYSATKKFGGNPLMGFVLGLMLISGSLPSGAQVGRGNIEPLMINLLGINFAIKGYQGSILIAVVGGYIITKVEQFCRKIVPNVVDMIFTPILTFTITLFVVLFGVGPIVQIIEAGLVSLFVAVLGLPLGIGGFITGALQQVLVITGMHHGLWIIDISLLEDTGMNLYQPVRNASMLGQAGACIAFAVFSKELKQRTNSTAASIAALFGITEPAIFGTTLAFGIPFAFGMIGAGFGAMFAVANELAAPGMGAGCIPGLLYYLDSGMGLYLTSSAIALGIPFVLSFLYIKKKGL